ncbi:MAG: phosphomannomutase/phosphoglucomutase [Alphaproteobacteria bacterium]|nr:phosphomannomutase/phosphoglucomutase [Alphaproteobacteria bacterium]
MKLIERIKDYFFTSDEDLKEKHVLNNEILREYDIRGIVGQTLFEEDAYDIGRAYGTFLNRKDLRQICVGWDCRNSSDTLAENLIKGLVHTGMKVTSLGVCHTPMMYYAVNKLTLDGGIMVTGSHNAPKYNGFKFMIGTSPFYGDDIKKLGEMIHSSDYIENNGREIILNSILANYIKDILSDFEFADELKVAWDIGNGATSVAIKTITSLIPGRHHLLFEEMDGNFPNRAPDPTVCENVAYLSKFVVYNNFDIGFAFDSDGDRLAVVNNEGEVLYSDQVLEVLAADFLKKNPGAQVISDVKACNCLFDSIKKFGGVPIMERVGHSFIKARMKTSGALLAGEMSGHFFFKDRWFGFDDGIYAALRCLEILSQNKGAFTGLEYGHVTPEIRVSCKESEKFKIIDEVKDKLRAQSIEFLDIDGVRVSSDNGWWLLRASNTQNALSLRIEAYTLGNMRKIKEEVASYLSEYNSNISKILEEEHE